MKVVFLGESGTGKTSLVSRCIDGTFTGDLAPTIGGCGRNVQTKFRDKRIDLVIWDTAGQERYRGLNPMFYRNAVAAVIVFDVSRRETFDHVQSWINELRTNVGPIILIICGNKVDLEGRTVSGTEGGALADTASASYVETSAKTGFGAELLFQTIVRVVGESRSGSFDKQGGKTIALSEEKIPAEKRCC
jgi:small GTP-binding protein